jgi:hypothetical protein
LRLEAGDSRLQAGVPKPGGEGTLATEHRPKCVGRPHTLWAGRVQIKKAPERVPAGVHSGAIDAFYLNLTDGMRRGRFSTDVAPLRLSWEGHSPCEPEWQVLHVDESLLAAANETELFYVPGA